MAATIQEVTNIRLTIVDCKTCVNWTMIQPLLRELFRACERYNDAIHNISTSPSDLEDPMQHIRDMGIEKHLTKVRTCIAKLHTKGVHFIKTNSLHTFCEAYYQAMQIEFKEEELNLAVY